MRHSIFIFNETLGKGDATYTVRAYTYEDAQPNKYNILSSPLYTYTSDGSGGYYADIVDTVKVTIQLTDSGGTITTPAMWQGALLHGDDNLNIDPTSLP